MNTDTPKLDEAATAEMQALERDLCEVLNRMARLRLSVSPSIAPPDTSPSEPRDLIEIAAAAQRARKSKDTVRGWCREHPFGKPGGFGVKLGGRWMVALQPFSKFVRNEAERS